MSLTQVIAMVIAIIGTLGGFTLGVLLARYYND